MENQKYFPNEIVAVQLSLTKHLFFFYFSWGSALCLMQLSDQCVAVINSTLSQADSSYLSTMNDWMMARCLHRLLYDWKKADDMAAYRKNYNDAQTELTKLFRYMGAIATDFSKSMGYKSLYFLRGCNIDF